MSHELNSRTRMSRNIGNSPPGPLPRRCSVEGTNAIECDVLRGSRAALGTFRCPVEHPLFRDTGPISECLVVFPRTNVWIRHEGSEPFLADPTVVTIYNRGQRYERLAASPVGDRCDWFAVSDDVAREIAGTFDANAAESGRPFRFEWSRSNAGLYLKQRALMHRAERGEVDLLEMEEVVIEIVAAVLGLAYGSVPRPLARRSRSVARHREIAEAAGVELFRTYERNSSVNAIAAAVGVSPYHLCRVFRAHTGMTMHQYRTELRVRMALEYLAGGSGPSGTLSAVAYRLGFASHAHFVVTMRDRLAATPGMVRAALGRQAT